MGNMFRCTLASGGALILTVTCDSAFAGQTITCTDGTTTLTQICPSTSPYTVEFKIPNVGTWTISSGINSTSVTIPDSAELHIIPNGSTITPTDDIQIWLHCANIWDKDYTTVSQVLSDASTLQALIASNNAADYMARSTSWASNVTANSSAMTYIGLNDYCANKLLANSTWRNAICNSTYFENVLTAKTPTMTSNTTPSGEVFGYANQGSLTAQAYKAIAASGGTYEAWQFPSNNQYSMQDAYLGYTFPNAIALYKASMKKVMYNLASQSGKWIVEGSNDKNVWTPLSSTKTYVQGSEASDPNFTINSGFGTPFKHFRIRCTNAVSGFNSFGAEEIMFYGR